MGGFTRTDAFKRVKSGFGGREPRDLGGKSGFSVFPLQNKGFGGQKWGILGPPGGPKRGVLGPPGGARKGGFWGPPGGGPGGSQTFAGYFVH